MSRLKRIGLIGSAYFVNRFKPINNKRWSSPSAKVVKKNSGVFKLINFYLGLVLEKLKKSCACVRVFLSYFELTTSFHLCFGSNSFELKFFKFMLKYYPKLFMFKVDFCLVQSSTPFQVAFSFYFCPLYSVFLTFVVFQKLFYRVRLLCQ
jgi:hypothetical protein